MVTFLLVFLVIFEYVLGAFAEITQFADRQFYDDWWNSGDWLDFSREWNIPVHDFFKRHVYSASRSANMSKSAATGLTFLISALAHELIMGCITRKFRGYGFFLVSSQGRSVPDVATLADTRFARLQMMCQMPFVAIQRAPWVRDQQLLNNGKCSLSHKFFGTMVLILVCGSHFLDLYDLRPEFGKSFL